MKKDFSPPEWSCTPNPCMRNAILRLEKDGKVIETIDIGKNACYIFGRSDETCDIVLKHPSSSRQHAAMLHDNNNQLFLLDLDSGHGTFIIRKDQESLKPHKKYQLQNNDRIKFGASSKTFVVNNIEPEIHVDDQNGIGEQERKAIERKKRELEIAEMTASMMKPVQPMRQNHKHDSNNHLDTDNTQIEYAEAEDEKDEEDDDQEDVAKDDIATRYQLPISHEVDLPGHSKSVSCIAVDPSGARIATGSMDYHVKLWDFAGMARTIKPFRDMEPQEGHPIVGLSYSPNGDRLIIGTGSSQPKIVDREGLDIIKFTKGDMYVIDMANTNGHTHSVTGVQWHRNEKDTVMTCSLDGTIRVWDLNWKKTFDCLINKRVFKLKSVQGKRIGVTCMTTTMDSNFLFGGTEDGQLQGFDVRKKAQTARPDYVLKAAHQNGSIISCIQFSNDGHTFASRASDDVLQIWDIRKSDTSLKSFNNVETVFPTANIAFNPSGTSVVVGTSVPKGKDRSGLLKFFDIHTALNEPIQTIGMENDVSVNSVAWPVKLNQLLVGLSTGITKVYYNPSMSTKGALLSSTKKLRPKNENDSAVRLDGVGKIHNPHSLPMYRDDVSKKRKRIKDRLDPVKSKAPEQPLTGPGAGGKIRGSSSFTQYYMKDRIKTSFREEDPREALLKYAKKAEENPSFLGNAYATTQPKDKLDNRYELAQRTLEQEKIDKEEEDRKLLDL